MRRNEAPVTTQAHKKYFVNPETGVHTNHVEGFWGSLKKMYRERWQSDVERVKERREACIYMFLARRRHRHTTATRELLRVNKIPASEDPQ